MVLVLSIAIRCSGGGGRTSRLLSSLHLHARHSSWYIPRPPIKCVRCRQSTTSTSSVGMAINNIPTISSNTSPEGQTTTRPPRRLSVAIVGAGPSGFYTAKYLSSAVLKKLQSTPACASVMSLAEAASVEGGGAAEVHHQKMQSSTNNFNYSGIDIDIIERLPTPYGLVRYGVAPDHPEVKNVEKEFASLFGDHDGVMSPGSSSSSIAKKLIAHGSHPHSPATSSLSYFGNVDVGHAISLPQLQNLYDIVVLAYGCQASDKRLGIPGEAELDGVLSAREFVAWYNGHPEFGHIGRIVQKCLWPSSSMLSEGDATNGNHSSSSSSSRVNMDTTISKARVVVIGQGNVALDVARILSKGTSGLMETDTPTSVLKVLKGGVSHVSIVGRRGHVQGAFTIKVRESFFDFAHVQTVVDCGMNTPLLFRY